MNAETQKLLRGALAFADCLKELQLHDRPTVRLSREDGVRLLGVITQCDSPFVEYLARERYQTSQGINTVGVSGINFEWPTLEAESVKHLENEAAARARPAIANGD